jgi:hypothetical protein
MTDPERARQIGLNEALFRHVNEKIEGLNDAFALVSDDFTVVCECGDIGCIDQLTVTRSIYERIRQRSTWFFVKPGHQEDDVERVVEEDEGFWIVEKRPGIPAQVADETNPRG